RPGVRNRPVLPGRHDRPYRDGHARPDRPGAAPDGQRRRARHARRPVFRAGCQTAEGHPGRRTGQRRTGPEPRVTTFMAPPPNILARAALVAAGAAPFALLLYLLELRKRSPAWDDDRDVRRWLASRKKAGRAKPLIGFPRPEASSAPWPWHVIQLAQ